MIDAGRAQRHDLEIGQLRADLLGEAVEANNRDLVALEEFDQRVALQEPLLGQELGARIARGELLLQRRKESK